MLLDPKKYLRVKKNKSKSKSDIVLKKLSEGQMKVQSVPILDDRLFFRNGSVPREKDGKYLERNL